MWLYLVGVVSGFILFPIAYVFFMNIVAEEHETHEY